jgi:putative dimethyl sulfoxide reductase chaperone
VDLVSEITALVSSRGDMYRLLARLYQVEVDAALLAGMSQTDWAVESDEPGIREGYRLLGAYLSQLGPDTVTDLAVDYARLFLGAGLAETGAAFPYESVYTHPDRLIMQDARDQVVQLYRAEGLDKIAEWNVPEDHIALEFEFMAHLCQKACQALATGDRPGASAYLEKQKSFLDQHLCKWIPGLCADIRRNAATDFYRGVALATEGYLHVDQALVDKLVAEVEVPAPSLALA